MDVRKLEKQLKKWFKDMKLEADSQLVEENGVKHIEVISIVTINDLADEEVQIRCLAYENGTSQVTFNFGDANINNELLELFNEFNINNFSLKVCSEYDQIRFYNQAFFQSPDDYMYNLDMTVSMLLKESTLDLIRPMLDYIKRG